MGAVVVASDLRLWDPFAPPLRLGERHRDFTVRRIFRHGTCGSKFYHVKRLAGLCHGLASRSAWPQDGLQHEKGLGAASLPISTRSSGADDATARRNHGGGFHTEPRDQEMCGYMKLSQKFTIANPI